MKRGRPLQSDRNGERISKLPADIIHRILTLLPIKEAAKTSLLSTEWKYRWRSIPQLVFDGDFATIPDIDPESVWHNEVMLKILQFLLVHDGPINKFELAIPGMSHCPQLNNLVHHLKTKTVKELALFLPLGELVELLPSSVFALDLNRLKVTGFTVVEPPWFMGFGNLTFLELKELILPVNFLETFLPKCPLLEELRVVECNTVSPVFVAPSLKVLFFHCHFESICFKYAPLLSVLTVLDNGKDEYVIDDSETTTQDTDMVALFAALPALQQLKLGLDLLLFLCNGDVPYKLPASLLELKVLEIPRLLLDKWLDMRVLVCFIMSSPNLQKLTIVHDYAEVNHPEFEDIDSLQTLLEPEDHSGVSSCLQRLEEFSIHRSRGTRVELELARFVLATAPVLKRIFIKPKKGLSAEKVANFVVELTQYKRISKEAEVKYAWTKKPGEA